MIHTIELQKVIPPSVFYQFNQSRAPQDRWANRLTFDYSGLNLKTTDFRKGIRKVTVQLLSNEQHSSEIAIIFLQLNASHLLGFAEPRNPIRITSNHIEKLCQRIDMAKAFVCETIKERTGIDINDFGRDFQIRRIDYAIDITTDNSAHSNEYIRLFHKGNHNRHIRPARYKNNYYASNHSKRKRSRRTINFYNKTDRERKSGNYAVADNLLRFEVQMGYEQIKAFANVKGLPNYQKYQNDNNYAWLFRLSEPILQEYCNMISVALPYYNLRTIRHIISDSGLTSAESKQIEDYLQYITNRGSSLHHAKKKHRIAIRLLEERNINPLPLHSSVRDTKTLKSIQAYIDEYFHPVPEPNTHRITSNRRRKKTDR